MAVYLREAVTIEERIQTGEFPFTIPIFAKGFRLRFESNVTFLVGENGTGKSTLLEAIAEKCGYSMTGGTRNFTWQRPEHDSPLASAMRLVWNRKAMRGFFLRAETFFNFATQLDEIADQEILERYGGKSLHLQSHGESFLALFVNRFRDGLFLLDEPEAALSPARQLSFLAVLHQLESSGGSQFIVATHSPMLMSYPGAQVFFFDESGIRRVEWTETEHYQITRRFLEAPERYYRHLFGEDDPAGD